MELVCSSGRVRSIGPGWLENRDSPRERAMATDTWTDGTANWDTASDWSAGLPGSSSAVVINSGEPELISGDAAISVASISVTGGVLAIQDPGVTQSVSGNVSVTGTGQLE